MNYPSDIKPLTSLRFFAAFWLLLYFFWPRLLINDGVRPNFIENGYLGVDLFFILSGFVLAHVYGPQIEKEKYTHSGFMWARFARVYPLHLVTFLAIFTIWAIGKSINFEFSQQAFDVREIPFHLTLTQAWGFIPNDGWNFPSWSISAEWFAYLTFPLSFTIASMFKKTPIAGLLIAFSVFYSLYGFFNAFGIELTNMTWEGGAVRIIPSFFAGIMLWFVGRANIFNPKYARRALFISLIALVVIGSIGILPYLLWPIEVAIVFFIAETSKDAKTEILGGKRWVYLGEISFAMYMVHLCVDIVLYKAIGFTKINITPELSVVLMILAILITIAVAAFAHAFIEKPMRDFLRKKVQFKAKNTKIEIPNIDMRAIGIIDNAKN